MGMEYRGDKENMLNSPFLEDITILEDVGNEKFQIVAAAEALYYVSFFEGFGIPILEGFSAGVPVVTSNVSSMAEVAQDAAYLVDPNESFEISQSMVDFASNPSIRERFIAKGDKRVLDFDWDKSARQTYAVLERISKK